ncbi:MAG: TlpA disulfide reductase family protein [Planctomycetota bacterium]
MPARLLSLLSIPALLAGCAGSAANQPPVSDQVALQTQSPLRSDLSTIALSSNSGDQPPRYVARKALPPAEGPSVPPVMLSTGHAKLCKVRVGDPFPRLTLPKLGGSSTDISSLYASNATVVLFWHPDRWMARTALIDMQRDIAAQFAAAQVSVVGIAVRQPQGAVQAALNQAQASFPQLIDTDGQAFASIGTQALPRIYVLDPDGKIVWFDIEYSEGTRRELWQTLAVLTK